MAAAALGKRVEGRRRGEHDRSDQLAGVKHRGIRPGIQARDGKLTGSAGTGDLNARAQRQAQASGSSPVGSPCARLPPMVPRLRTCRSPMCRTTVAIMASRPAISGEYSTVECRTTCPEHCRVTVRTNVAQLIDAVNVDQRVRPQQPRMVEHRGKALARPSKYTRASSLAYAARYSTAWPTLDTPVVAERRGFHRELAHLGTRLMIAYTHATFVYWHTILPAPSSAFVQSPHANHSRRSMTGEAARGLPSRLQPRPCAASAPQRSSRGGSARAILAGELRRGGWLAAGGVAGIALRRQPDPDPQGRR